jgi:hypothetical protein
LNVNEAYYFKGSIVFLVLRDGFEILQWIKWPFNLHVILLRVVVNCQSRQGLHTSLSNSSSRIERNNCASDRGNS